MLRRGSYDIAEAEAEAEAEEEEAHLGYKQRVQLRTTNRSHEAFNSSVIAPAPTLFLKGQMLEENFSGYIALD